MKELVEARSLSECILYRADEGRWIDPKVAIRLAKLFRFIDLEMLSGRSPWWDKDA